jgi:hypothetical protein
MGNQAIDHGRSKGNIVAQEDLSMAGSSMRGTHNGASFIPIDDHLEAELKPLLAYEQTTQRTIDDWLGVGMKGIKPMTGIIGSRRKKQKIYFLPLE